MKLSSIIGGLTLAIASYSPLVIAQDVPDNINSVVMKNNIMTITNAAKEPYKPIFFDYKSCPKKISDRLDSAKYFGIDLCLDTLESYRNFISPVIVDRKCDINYQENTTLPKICLKAKLSSDSTIHIPNKIHDNIASIYFKPESSKLSRKDSSDIQNIAKDIASQYHDVIRDYRGKFVARTIKNILIIGRADQTISSKFDNMSLSENRGEAVAKLLTRYLKDYCVSVPQDVPLELVAYGDVNPVCTGKDSMSYALNRVTDIIINERAMQRALDEIVADETLIDFSHSMTNIGDGGYSPMDILKGYDYECNDSVSAFVKLITFKDGLKMHLPDWHHLNDPEFLPDSYLRWLTPFKEVMLLKVLTMDKGKTIRVLTDGAATKSIITDNEIINVALERDIKISCISIAKTAEYSRILQNLSAKTGGRFFTIQKIRY